MPVGIAMMIVVIIIGTRSQAAMPLTNMRCAQTPKPSTAIATVANASAVAEHQLARGGRDDLADYPEAGHRDVHGRVRVEPEDAGT